MSLPSSAERRRRERHERSEYCEEREARRGNLKLNTLGDKADWLGCENRKACTNKKNLKKEKGKMEEKKTRRNKRILIISAMLVLLIALLCFGGTTFAKYITSKNVPVEQATVAKWGFVVKVDGDKLFSSDYGKSVAVGSGDATIDVKADTADSGERKKIVAPGTTGSLTISIDGNAEVDAKVKIFEQKKDDGTVKTERKDVSLKSKSGVTPDVDYKPVKWTLDMSVKIGEAEATVTKVEAKTLDECMTALLKEYVVKAGQSVTISCTLSWKWWFGDEYSEEGDSKTALFPNDQSDEYDTLLGWAAEGTGYTYETDEAAKVGDVTVSGSEVTVKGETTDAVYTAETNIAFELGVSVEQTHN